MEIEKLHLFLCKFALGVKSSTPNDAIYAELGRYPLQLCRQISMIKYAMRLGSYHFLAHGGCSRNGMKDSIELVIVDPPLEEAEKLPIPPCENFM